MSKEDMALNEKFIVSEKLLRDIVIADFMKTTYDADDRMYSIIQHITKYLINRLDLKPLSFSDKHPFDKRLMNRIEEITIAKTSKDINWEYE